MKESLKDAIKDDAVVVGQSYDGAANMAGKNNSVQTLIQKDWPHAKFVHCYAHKLALVIKGACSGVKMAVDFFETLSTMCTFFRSSPKRGCLLDKRVPQAAYTRWLTRGKCVTYFHQNKLEIFRVLEELSFSDDAQTRLQAQALLKQLKTWENMFLLDVFQYILTHANVLSTHLQKRVIDGQQAKSKMDDFMTHLEAMRPQKEFDAIMTRLKALDEEVEFTPAPRVRPRNEQLMRDSGYAPSAHAELTQEQKLKQGLIAILDGLYAEFNARFGNLDDFMWMQMLDPANFHYMQDKVIIQRCISNLKNSYPFIKHDNLTIEAQFLTLYGDSELRKHLGKEVNDISSLLEKLYKLDIQKALPVVTDIANLAASMAITSVSCERTFSVLRRIKTYQRNTMTQNRTRNLMVLAVESELTHTLAQESTFCDKVIDRFANKSDRRINLIYKK